MSTSTSITSKSAPARCVLPLATLLCALGTTPSWSAPKPPSVTVSYRDLDLSSVAGATTLYQRIQGAARQVCGYAGADLIEQEIWKACYRSATADAVRQVHNPLLTAVHEGRKPEMTAMLSK
jgi:UrcA family protein